MTNSERTASKFIPSNEERAFTLRPIETERGINVYEIDRTVRFDVTDIGSKFVKRLSDLGIINLNSSEGESRVYFIICANSRTNFNSIPRLLRWLVSPIQPALIIASFVHDWATNEFDDDTFEVFKYKNDFYISKNAYGRPLYDNVTLKDLKGLVGEYHAYSHLGYCYIKWSESAEVYRELGRIYKGKTNKISTRLAYNALRLAGFFKRVFGDTK